jgi:PAS domain S-box-containing protein
VTDERRRERELRRQKTLLEQTQRLAGAWEADFQTGEVSWSEKVYEIHELEPGTEICLEDGLGFYASESKGKVEDAIEALTEERAPYDVELKLNTAEGNRRWVRTVGAPVETSGGEVTKVAGAFQDITERKEEERRRKQVIERVTDGIVEVDSDWQITLVNDQAETTYGMSAEELLGKSVWEAFDGLEGTRFEETYRAVMETREPARIEAYYPGLDGWFDVQVYPNADGGLAVYFEEITERKEREETLRRQEERLRSITENVTDGIYRSSPDKGIIYANQALAEMFGYERPDELLEVDPAIFYARSDGRKRVTEESNRQGGIRNLEVQFRRRDGTTFTGLISGTVVRGEDGEVRYYDGAITDISERKRRKKKLERQNDLFERAQEIADVGAWEYDVQSDEMMMTDVAYRIGGLPPNERMTRERGLSFYHPEDQSVIREAIARAVEEGTSYDLELRLITRDGEQRWVRTRGEPQRENGEVVRLRGTIQDITERKKREQELREAKEEAEEADRIKTALLTNMNHELRTPLTSIISFAELIDKKPGAASRFADRILGGGKRLLYTLNTVMAFAQLEGEGVSEDPSLSHPRDVVRSVANDYRGQAERKDLDLTVDISGAGSLFMDGGFTEQVVEHLLHNAVKFTNEGEIIVSAQIEEEGVEIGVSDTGAGIDPAFLPEVFEEFTQESTGLDRTYEGNGLGLTVAKRLVDQMGGDISIESEPEEGTTVIVWVPDGR